MKKVIFLFALILGLATTTYSQSTEPSITLTNEFSISIDNTTTRNGLLELKTELASYGITFMYSPSFTKERKLNGIKVRLIDENQEKHEYSLNPMGAEDSLILERKNNEEGELIIFVGEK